MTEDAITDADGIPRCGWAYSHPEMLAYHDDEWGRVLHGDRPLFEKLCLEAFQSGLSWITILRKRAAFRTAFADFEIARVAAFDDTDIARLLGDARIVRNGAKIRATIANARAAQRLVSQSPGALDALIWRFAPPRREVAPPSHSAVPAIVPESVAASATLKSLGFSFVGPTTLYALMQYAGLTNDHTDGCFLAVTSPAG